MLKSVRLKNFKLHEDTSIEAALITVFIGPNNSGKSSVFQALLALKQAAARGGQTLIQSPQVRAESPFAAGRGGQEGSADDQIVDLGEFKDVIRDGESQLCISSVGTIESWNPSLRNLPLNISFEIYVRDDRIAAHEGSVESRYGRISWRRAAGSAEAADQQRVQYREWELYFAVADSFPLIGSSGYRPPGGPTPEIVAEIQDVRNYLGSAPSLLMRSVHPIYPLRGLEQSGFPLPPGATGSMERPTLFDRTLAIATSLAYDSRLLERVSERLESLLGLTIRLDLIPGPRVTIRAVGTENSKKKTLFANEGTGANQLPFILVPIALTPPNETVLLSEPEAHLHPKRQSELTAMLIGIAKKENLQFFIETHSEHVLHRLLHAVGKGELEKSEVALYYFENRDGKAEINRLRINERGQVDGGLPGFFEQSLGELSEYLDALRKP